MHFTSTIKWNETIQLKNSTYDDISYTEFKGSGITEMSSYSAGE